MQVGRGVGVLGQVFPPTSERPAGSPTPKCTGGGRVSQTLAPQGVRWRGATPTPATPRGSPGRTPPPHAAKVLRSCGPARSRGQCPPGGHPQVLTPGLDKDPHHSCQALDWPPGSLQAPEGSSRSQAWSPGPAPVAWARPPHHLPGEGASLLPFTFRCYLEGIYRCRGRAPTPYGLPRVLISDPGSSFLDQEPHLSLLPTD